MQCRRRHCVLISVKHCNNSLYFRIIPGLSKWGWGKKSRRFMWIWTSPLLFNYYQQSHHGLIPDFFPNQQISDCNVPVLVLMLIWHLLTTVSLVMRQHWVGSSSGETNGEHSYSDTVITPRVSFSFKCCMQDRDIRAGMKPILDLCVFDQWFKIEILTNFYFLS